MYDDDYTYGEMRLSSYYCNFILISKEHYVVMSYIVSVTTIRKIHYTSNQ